MALQIAKELRSWFVLKQKAILASIGAKEDTPDNAQVPQHELIALARALVESRIDDPDVRAWIVGLYERVKSDPVSQEEE